MNSETPTYPAPSNRQTQTGVPRTNRLRPARELMRPSMIGILSIVILLAVITEPGVAYSSGSGKLPETRLQTRRHRPRPAPAEVLLSGPGSAATESSGRRPCTPDRTLTTPRNGADTPMAR